LAQAGFVDPPTYECSILTLGAMAHLQALLTGLLWAEIVMIGAGLLLRSDRNNSQSRSGLPTGGALHSSSTVADHVHNHEQAEEKTKQRNSKARDRKMPPCLEGKRIVFVGPSTSKFDYLTLAYFAEYGTWPSQDTIMYGQGAWGPNPLDEGTCTHSTVSMPPQATNPGCQSPTPYGTETCHRYTNSIFNGHEACDCYEFGTWSQALDIYNSTENRVYINGNTMISYFQYMGDAVPPRGTFDITPLLKQPPQPIQQPCGVGQFPGTWQWSQTLPDFLRNVIKYANPTHVVLSASFWTIVPQNIAFWADVAAAGAEAVAASQGQVIWKTTPQRIHESMPHRYNSPRVDMTPFAAMGWKVFPAAQIVQTYQGASPNNAVFYDFAHLRPHTQCHMTQAFLATHVCPGVPI